MLFQAIILVARHMLSNAYKLRPRGAGTLVRYWPIFALRRSCTTLGRATILEVSMRNSLAILIGTLCAAGTLQAAPATQIPSTTKNEMSPPPMQQVKTAEWGFEAPNMFRLEPQ